MPAAARIGDAHSCPSHSGGPVAQGDSTVLIDGKPAAVLGSQCTCKGPPDSISKGSTTVYIGGKPAARKGDPTAHGGAVTAGSPTVDIGG